MIHPDLNRVSHLANVRAEIRAYRESYAIAAKSGQQHSDAWAPVKAAELRINELVENTLAPK